MKEVIDVLENKKGFTLIEIIICISLITLIGVGSIIGVKTISQNITIRELNQIENKIYEAVSIFVETNKETKEKLYIDKNAVVVPLNVLKNTGLVDFGNINIEDQYVLTTLGSEDKDSKCIDTTVVGTWEKEDDTVIYLCADEKEYKTEVYNVISEIINDNGNNLNITVNTINNDLSVIKNDIANIKNEIIEIKNILSETPKEDIYFTLSLPLFYKGNVSNNYIKLENGSQTYRILYIEADRSIAIYNYDKFTEFKDNQIYASLTNRILVTEENIKNSHDSLSLRCGTSGDVGGSGTNRYLSENGGNKEGTLMDTVDIMNTITCRITGEYPYTSNTNVRYDLGVEFNSWLLPGVASFNRISNSQKRSVECSSGYDSSSNDFAGRTLYDTRILCGNSYLNLEGAKQYKLLLKPCMKIVSGTGINSDPYILKNTCS